MKCPLCGRQNIALSNSHILTESIIKQSGVFDNKHKLMMINRGGDNEDSQDGIVEKLLCGKCEARLNNTFECKGAHMFSKGVFNPKKYNYAVLKGVLLLNLWRMCYAHHPMFKNVKHKISIKNLNEIKTIINGPLEKVPGPNVFPIIVLGPHQDPYISAPGFCFHNKGKWTFNNLDCVYFYFLHYIFIIFIGISKLGENEEFMLNIKEMPTILLQNNPLLNQINDLLLEGCFNEAIKKCLIHHLKL